MSVQSDFHEDVAVLLHRFHGRAWRAGSGFGVALAMVVALVLGSFGRPQWWWFALLAAGVLAGWVYARACVVLWRRIRYARAAEQFVVEGPGLAPVVRAESIALWRECPRCGTRLGPGIRICPACGTSTSDVVVPRA